MFHVELRRFPHVGRAFNLDRDELLARFVMPWIRGAEISLDERHWAHDVKTRLTVYDGPPIAPEEVLALYQRYGIEGAEEQRSGKNSAVEESASPTGAQNLPRAPKAENAVGSI